MKKLLITLAAISSVNAYAATVGVKIHNNTQCPLTINGHTVQVGSSYSDIATSDGTFTLTEMTSYADGSEHCNITAASVAMSVSGNAAIHTKDNPGTDYFTLNIAQSGSDQSLSSPFKTEVKVDGLSKASLSSDQDQYIGAQYTTDHLVQAQEHRIDLNISGSGTLPTPVKPVNPSPEPVAPQSIKSFISNLTNCPLTINGQEVPANIYYVPVTINNGVTQVIEHTDLKLGDTVMKCQAVATTNITYTPFDQYTPSSGAIKVSQSKDNSGDKHFIVRTIIGNGAKEGQQGVIQSAVHSTYTYQLDKNEHMNPPLTNIYIGVDNAGKVATQSARLPWK